MVVHAIKSSQANLQLLFLLLSLSLSAHVARVSCECETCRECVYGPYLTYIHSQLTRLLEDSLGSSSKCVMVVNVSPAAENVAETKCSLEFASRARKVGVW